MIEEYVEDLAFYMGIQLSQVSFIDGSDVGCIDTHLLNLSADDHRVSTLVYQTDLDELKGGLHCKRLEAKIWVALTRLQVMLEP